MKYFALFMCVVYVLVGCLFLFTNALAQHIPHLRLPLGLLLVGYGAVRAYLWRRKYTDQTEND